MLVRSLRPKLFFGALSPEMKNKNFKKKTKKSIYSLSILFKLQVYQISKEFDNYLPLEATPKVFGPKKA